MVYKYKVYQNFYYTSNLYQVYWASIENNDTFVYQESYNNSILLDQIWKIKISYRGVDLIEQIQYIIPDQQSSKEKSEILKSDIIDWELSDHLHAAWIIKNSNKKLKRIRTSATISDSLEFQKTKFFTYTFTDRINVKEYNPVGRAFKRKLTRTSYHLEGIGLYKSVQKYPDVFITFELEEILNYDEWQKMKESL